MNASFTTILRLALQCLDRQCRAPLVRLSRIEGAIVHVKAVRTMRLGVLAAMGILLLAVLAVGSFLLMHVGLVLYLPVTPRVKGLILLICAGVYFVASAAVLACLMRQRFWLKVSKADEAIAKALAREGGESCL